MELIWILYVFLYGIYGIDMDFKCLFLHGIYGIDMDSICFFCLEFMELIWILCFFCMEF